MEEMWDFSNYRGTSLLVRCNKIYMKILAYRINEREGKKITRRISAWLSESSRVPRSRHYLMETGREIPEGCVWLLLIIIKQTRQNWWPVGCIRPVSLLRRPASFLNLLQTPSNPAIYNKLYTHLIG